MDTTDMQQVLRNYGHSDARAAIAGKQSYEWERALRDAGFSEAAKVVTKFVPPQARPSLNDMQTTGRPTGPQPPPGKAPLRSLADLDALEAEGRDAVAARMDEVDVLLRSERGNQ